MIHRFVSHLRGNFVAYLALFVALGGTSYAAVSIPRNSVGTKQLRNGAVTLKKLNARSFGEHILFTAHVNPFGRVLDSQPRGARTEGWDSDPNRLPDGGLITWHRAIPQRCFALSDSDGPIQPSNGEPAYSSASIAPSPTKRATVGIATPAPEGVYVAVICPAR